MKATKKKSKRKLNKCKTCGKPTRNKYWCSFKCQHKFTKNKKCAVCGRKLKGRQTKFCSVICSKKEYSLKKDFNKKTKIAYVIEDKYYGELPVKYTPNAWWKDENKVRKLIYGLKMDCKPREFRLLAGITKAQYDYFMQVHPEFSAIFKDFRAIPTLKARQTVIRQVQTDGNLAFKYLERKEPDEFKEKKEIELNEQPILIDDIMK